MASTDLKIKSTYGGKSQTLTVSDANTQASDAVLLQFGQKIIDLTDNVYGSTDKVTTLNLDTETSASKQIPTLTLNPTSISAASLQTATYVDISYTYSGDANEIAVQMPIATATTVYARTDNNGVSLNRVSSSITIVPGIVKIIFPETDNYQAITAEFTIS